MASVFSVTRPSRAVISALFSVIASVFSVTRPSRAVISALFAVMASVFSVTRVSRASISELFSVTLSSTSSTVSLRSDTVSLSPETVLLRDATVLLTVAIVEVLVAILSSRVWVAVLTASSTYFSVASSSGPAKAIPGSNIHETAIASALRLKFIIDGLNISYFLYNGVAMQ